MIQAPMAGAGILTAELVIASCRAGVLGMVAATYRSLEQIRGDAEAIRYATDRPFAINLFAPTLDPDNPAEVEPILRFMTHWHDKSGLPLPEIPLRVSEDFAETIELIAELNPPVVSFTFGLLPEHVIQKLKQRDIFVIGTATTVSEAVQLEKSDVDAIIAQGVEAGGHRSSFNTSDGAGMIGTMALVPQVCDAVHVPVVASSGIMDGRGITAALALGVVGVQMGTAFQVTDEPGDSQCYKQRTIAERTTATSRTSSDCGIYACAGMPKRIYISCSASSRSSPTNYSNRIASETQ